MRLREFAPSPDHSGGGDGDFRMSWDQILDMYRQILTHTLGWKLTAGPGRSAQFIRGRAVFSVDQGLSPTIFRYRLEDTGQVIMSGFAHTLYSSVQSVLDRVKQKGIMEFAPSPGYEPDPEDDVPRYLMQLANLWWNQADPEAQEEVARELAGGGWTIRQIDDDTVLLNHKEYGITYRISDDQFDPDLHE